MPLQIYFAPVTTDNIHTASVKKKEGILSRQLGEINDGWTEKQIRHRGIEEDALMT